MQSSAIKRNRRGAPACNEGAHQRQSNAIDEAHLHCDQGAQTVAMAQRVDSFVKCAYDRGLLEHVDWRVPRQPVGGARIDRLAAQQTLEQRVVVRRLGRLDGRPREGARVLAHQAHAVR